MVEWKLNVSMTCHGVLKIAPQVFVRGFFRSLLSQSVSARGGNAPGVACDLKEVPGRRWIGPRPAAMALGCAGDRPDRWPFPFSTDDSSGGRHAMKCAQFIAVGIAKVGEIQRTDAALTNARRVFNCHAAIRNSSLVPGVGSSGLVIAKPIVPPLACVADLPSIGLVTRNSPPLYA
jgi:hypothetical protein